MLEKRCARPAHFVDREFQLMSSVFFDATVLYDDDTAKGDKTLNFGDKLASEPPRQGS
jgi:hypothetical protein